MALVQRIRLSRIRRPTTGAYYTHVNERARCFLRHCVLALVPAALQISSERLAQDPGERTCLCQQRLRHVLCRPLGDLFFFALSWHAAQPNAQISLTFVTIAPFAHLEYVDAVRYARALQASFAADPAGALARLQQDVPR